MHCHHPPTTESVTTTYLPVYAYVYIGPERGGAGPLGGLPVLPPRLVQGRPQVRKRGMNAWR